MIGFSTEEKAERCAKRVLDGDAYWNRSARTGVQQLPDGSWGVVCWAGTPSRPTDARLYLPRRYIDGVRSVEQALGIG